MMTVEDLFDMDEFALTEMTDILVKPNVVVKVYPGSIRKLHGTLFFMANSGMQKFLYLVSQKPDRNVFDLFKDGCF